MYRIFWITLGVVLGFFAAHFVSRTSTGERLFRQIDQGAREFTDAVARGYRSREAEFSSQIADDQHAVNDLKNS